MADITTAKNILASATNPTIAYGGQSSSTALNQINSNLRSDLLALDSDIAAAELELARNRALMSCQSSAFGAALSHLASDLDYIRANMGSKVRVDLYDGRYVDNTATTASIDNVFGQATLAVSGQSDWLVARDLENNVWIPKNTKIRYACNNDGHIPDDTLDYSEDEQFTYALDGDPGTMWVQEKTDSHIFLDIQVPIETTTNTMANTLILRPFPVFCHDLVSIDIISQSGNVQTIGVDRLKYLPGYNGTTVSTIADTRIFFPPTQVARVRVHMQAGNFPYWGFSEIALKTTTFQATNSLVFDLNPLKGSYTQSPKLTLHGSDDIALAKIIPSIDNFKATYSLAQQADGYTPVITAVDVEWL